MADITSSAGICFNCANLSLTSSYNTFCSSFFSASECSLNNTSPETSPAKFQLKHVSFCLFPQTHTIVVNLSGLLTKSKPSPIHPLATHELYTYLIIPSTTVRNMKWDCESTFPKVQNPNPKPKHINKLQLCIQKQLPKRKPQNNYWSHQAHQHGIQILHSQKTVMLRKKTSMKIYCRKHLFKMLKFLSIKKAYELLLTYLLIVL